MIIKIHEICHHSPKPRLGNNPKVVEVPLMQNMLFNLLFGKNIKNTLNYCPQTFETPQLPLNVLVGFYFSSYLCEILFLHAKTD